MKAEALLKLLSDYKNQGLLHAIDLEFARFLYKSQQVFSYEVLLAVCLTSYLYRQGNVCLTLEDYDGRILFSESEMALTPLQTPTSEQWKQQLSDSSVVGSPGEFKPLILDDAGRLYLHKLWKQERSLADNLLQKTMVPNRPIAYEKLHEGLNRMFSGSSASGIDWQRVAAVAGVLKPLVIISGGPGTGKTSTVIRILALLLEQIQGKEEKSIEIALAAPTGKAAARLKDSILQQKIDLKIKPQILAQIPDSAVTLHRLLGARFHSDSFTFNEDNLLSHDLIVVDEASMVDQRLMNSLLLAMKPSARLILLGDKDQLASVEAGSVLGDICGKEDNSFSVSFSKSLEEAGLVLPSQLVSDQPAPLTDNIVRLKHNYRFTHNSGISQLIESIKKGGTDTTISLLHNGYEDIQLRSYESFDVLWESSKSAIRSYFEKVQNAELPSVLLNALKQFKILCAHRKGPAGIQNVNRQIEKQLLTDGFINSPERWYAGRPVIIRSNSYQLQLRNGDIGVCQQNERGEWVICFLQNDESDRHEVKKIHPERLPSYEIAYALTVHQSQGSEFDEVLLVLPNYASRILTRELLYTAVSRARKKITIMAQKKILRETIANRIARHSGLKEYLWNQNM